MKNYLPYCQCYDTCSEQAEYTIVYGKSVTNDYAFACNKHIGELIAKISAGKHGKVTTFYAKHFTSKKPYDEKWNNEWRQHVINCD